MSSTGSESGNGNGKWDLWGKVLYFVLEEGQQRSDRFNVPLYVVQGL